MPLTHPANRFASNLAVSTTVGLCQISSQYRRRVHQPTGMSLHITTTLDSCWLGTILPRPIELTLQIASNTITFSGTVPWQVSPNSLSTTGFTADLWKRDVVEFFIAKKNSPAYAEFNLAPSSAWWCAEHLSYRRPLSSLKATSGRVSTSCSVTPHAWHFFAEIPLNELFPHHGCTSLAEIESINLASIQGIERPDSAGQRFFAANATPNRPTAPDFHFRHTFLLLQP